MERGQDLLGLSLLLFSMVMLGTWPALLRLCSLHTSYKEENQGGGTPGSSPRQLILPPYEEEGGAGCYYRIDRPRNVCHAYLDYATAYFLISCLPFLVTLLVTNLEEDEEAASGGTSMSWPLIATAMLGGSLLSCGNLSLQWATTVFKAPLTTVLALQASLTVVIGTSINYLLQPSKTGRPSLLFAGVVVFLIAIGLATTAQILYSRRKQQQSHHDHEDLSTSPVAGRYKEIELQYGSTFGNPSPETTTHRQLVSSTSPTSSTSSEPQSPESDVEHPDSPSSSLLSWSDSTRWSTDTVMLGVYVAGIGGLCFGFFSPAFNVAVNDPFGWTKNVDGTNESSSSGNGISNSQLSVPLANLWFSFAFWVASVVGNVILLRRQSTEEASTLQVLQTYIQQDGLIDRSLALTAGLVCALGNVFQFQGGQLVGYATADLVQAYPLISTVWDVLLFREFRSVPLTLQLWALLIGMYLSYLGGVVLMAGSSL